MTKEEILKKCVIEGNVVKLPQITLDRKLYLEVAKALELIGGKWKGGKVSGFIFQEDPTDYLSEITEGKVVNLKKEFQFFATPDTVADYIIENYVFNLFEDDIRILEPSAGQGSLIKAIHRKNPDVLVHYCELMELNRKFLSKIPNTVFVTEDFLSIDKDDKYDLIIANPPFSKNQDIQHIYQMYLHLNEGGRLISIASKHWEIASGKKEEDFRYWLELMDAEIYPLDRGLFKESGTMVGTNLIVIDK